jgi:hypothetical protein
MEGCCFCSNFFSFLSMFQSFWTNEHAFSMEIRDECCLVFLANCFYCFGFLRIFYDNQMGFFLEPMDFMNKWESIFEIHILPATAYSSELPLTDFCLYKCVLFQLHFILGHFRCLSQKRKMYTQLFSLASFLEVCKNGHIPWADPITGAHHSAIVQGLFQGLGRRRDIWFWPHDVLQSKLRFCALGDPQW